MAIDNYVTALRNGQLELAKASGRTYGFHTTELASTGIAGQGTTNTLTGFNVDASTAGLTLKTPLAVPASPAQGHIWQAGEEVLFRGSAATKTLFDLSTANQSIVAAKGLAANLSLTAAGGINASVAGYSDGMIVPVNSGTPVGAATEGAIVWDSSAAKALWAYNGTSWQQLTSAAVLPTNTTAGSVIIGTGTGWAEETDVKISSAGLITVGATGGLDFNGVNVDIDNTGTFDVLSSGIFSIDGTGASNVSATSGSLTLSTITSGSLIGTSVADIDLNAATNFTLDCAAGTMSLDCTGVANFTSSGAAVTVSGVGAFIVGGNAEIDVTTTGAVDINSAAGTWDASSGLALTTSAGLFDINAAAGLDIDVTGTFDMLSTGAFSVDGTGASNVSATSGSLTLSTLTSGSLILTSITDVDINATTGVTIDGTGISIDGTAASNFTVTGAVDLTLSSTLGSVVVTSGESAADGVRINATGANGGVDIDALLGGVAIDTTAGISLDAAGASNFTVAGAQLQLSTTGSGEMDFTAAGLIDINAAAGLDIDVTGTTALTSSTGTTIENTTSGNILIDSQGVTSKIIAMLGTDTAATGLEIQNNSATVLFSIVGTGQAEFNYGVGIDGAFRIGAAGADKVTVDSATGDTLIAGNLTVTGTMFIADTQQVLIEDNNLYLNCTDVTPGAGTGGITVNYNPTAVTDTVAATGFVAHSGAANAKVYTTGAATFGALVGAFIQITGSNNAANKGLFEVLSHAANVLTIRGLGTTACQEDFTQNEFVTDTTVAGVITQVNVSVIRAGTDGAWEVAQGSSSPTGTPLTFVDLVTSASGLTLQAAYVGGNTITTSSGEGDLTFAGTEDLIVTLADINLDPTGTFDLAMLSGQSAKIHISDNLGLAFQIREGTNDYLLCQTTNNIEMIQLGNSGIATMTTIVHAGSTVRMNTPNMGYRAIEGTGLRIWGDGSYPLDIQTVTSLNYTGADINLDPTGHFTLDMDAGRSVTFTIADARASAFKIQEGANTYLDITTSDLTEVLTLGNSGIATLETYAASPIRFGAANTKGTIYQDKYGTHVVCYLPATKSSTIAQGVAFLTSGAFEVSGLAADVDQVTVREMVRGVAQATVAATGYVKVQTSGIAEVEVDQTGTPLLADVLPGTLLKWALNGKICLDTRDLTLSAPYYEELAGVVVAAADRAGTAYGASGNYRVQIMLMNPVIGTYIPA